MDLRSSLINEYDWNSDKETEKHVQNLIMVKLVQNTLLFPHHILYVHQSIKNQTKIKTNKMKQ